VDISAEGAPVRAAVVPAREEIQMAREIRDLLDRGRADSIDP
jgi:hypothetical protein